MFQKLPTQKGVTFLDQISCTISQTLSTSTNSRNNNNNSKLSTTTTNKSLFDDKSDTINNSNIINNFLTNHHHHKRNNEQKLNYQRRFSTGVNNFIQKCQRSSSNPLATYNQQTTTNQNAPSPFNSNSIKQKGKARYNLTDFIANSYNNQATANLHSKRRGSFASTLLNSTSKQHYSSTSQLFSNIKSKKFQNCNLHQQQHQHKSNNNNNDSLGIVVKETFSRLLKGLNKTCNSK